jgi:hypothetical protein
MGPAHGPPAEEYVIASSAAFEYLLTTDDALAGAPASVLGSGI